MARVQSEAEILEIIKKQFIHLDPAINREFGNSDSEPLEFTFMRGDDCAEIHDLGSVALSTDLFLEDAHFRTAYFLPEEIGHKALAVNLSDLAAAGASPAGFSLGFICPRSGPGLEKKWLRALFGGMAELAGLYHMPLSGGDISAGDKLGFCITIWGKAVPQGWGRSAFSNQEEMVLKDYVFLRRGAKPGWRIFTLGSKPAIKSPTACYLGLARLGLEMLEKDGREALKRYPAACMALLTPTPEIFAGHMLAVLNKQWRISKQDVAAAPCCLMDISDGLARDLPRLLAGAEHKRKLGCFLDFDPGILHPELHAFAAETGDSAAALRLALSGGDDYMLLGAADPEFLEMLVKDKAHYELQDEGFNLNILGTVTDTPGFSWQGESLAKIAGGRGFDHFDGAEGN